MLIFEGSPQGRSQIPEIFANEILLPFVGTCMRSEAQVRPVVRAVPDGRGPFGDSSESDRDAPKEGVRDLLQSPTSIPAGYAFSRRRKEALSLIQQNERLADRHCPPPRKKRILIFQESG